MKIGVDLSNKLANASLIAALGVVAIHLPTPNSAGALRLAFHEYISMGLCKAAVPFFFLVSGFLLAGRTGESGWWKGAVSKRMRSLFVPYLFWCLVFAALIFAAKPAPFGEWLSLRGWLVFGMDLTDTPLLTPMWYLRTLMLFVLASPLIVGSVSHRLAAYTVLPLLFLSYFAFALAVEINPGLIANPVMALLRQTFRLEALFYFALGIYFRRREGNGEWPLWGQRWLPVSSLLLAVGLLCLRIHYGLLIPYPVVIPFVLLGFWGLVPSRSWPKWLTALSFPIYVLHFFVTHVAKVMLGWRNDEFSTMLVVYFAAVGISAFTALLLHRFLPRIAGIIFGGR